MVNILPAKNQHASIVTVSMLMLAFRSSLKELLAWLQLLILLLDKSEWID